MGSPRSNRTLWILAGVLVVIAAAVAVVAVEAGGKQPKKASVTPATTATSTTGTSTTPAKRRVNNFTVPFYGNQATRTRDFTAIRSLHPPFKLAWKFGGNALLEFPATIWGNNLYLLDDGATVKRINITTGKQIWKRHMGTCKGCGLSASSPALDVAHKELFVSVLSLTGSTIGAVGGELAAVSMRSGKTLWRFPVSSGTESSPMVVGNSVYFGDQGGTEYSLNIRTGHENWSLSTDGSIKAGAAYHGGDLFFGTYGGSFYAVNAKSGKEVWSASPGGEFYSTPAIAYGHVYVGNNDGDAYAFDLNSGAIAWSTGVGGYAYSGPAVADTPGLGPTVYIGSYGGGLHALDAETGGVRWDASLGSISGSATVVNNTVYVSTVYSPGSYGFNARTGAQVFSFPDGSYTTVVADRNALFLMGKYTLYKFVPKSAKVPRAKVK
jgi:outer membrane protein assembly factor BamB